MKKTNFCNYLHDFFNSINGDGAAEPVSDDMNQSDEEDGAEEFSSSWPATFTSTMADAEESDSPKQVAFPYNDINLNIALT